MHLANWYLFMSISFLLLINFKYFFKPTEDLESHVVIVAFIGFFGLFC